MFRSLILMLAFLGLNADGRSYASNASVNFESAPLFQEIELLAVYPIPRKKEEAVAPVINSKSALLLDVNSGVTLYEKNQYEKLPMASLTKIMTAVVILESHELDEVVTVEENFSNYGEVGVRMWLQQYEKMTVENLLTALLVRSAGDAAVALAQYHSGSVDDFVVEMNERAKALNLINTHFTNPIGLDNIDHYSTAHDLSVLTQYALRNSDFRRMVQIDRITVASTDGEIKHTLDSTNYLLNSYLDIRGVKTGTTEGAGESLINLAYHPDGKGEVISILLDSPERFQESKRLIDWSFRNYIW